METGQPLDYGQGSQSTHDETAPLSLREAAAHAGVTEKTIRRWIKSERLTAEMQGGQYWISVDALERAQAAPPRESSVSTPGDNTDAQRVPTMDIMGVHRHGSPGVDLQPLVDHIARLEGKVQELTEAATVWQIRAVQAEDRVRALEAGPLLMPDAAAATDKGSGEAMPIAMTEDAARADASLWGRFCRALMGRS